MPKWQVIYRPIYKNQNLLQNMNTKSNQLSTEPLLTPIKVTFLTQTQLAKELGVCRETVCRWTREELIPVIRIGKKSVRYDLAEVREHLIRQSKAERIESELGNEIKN